MKKPLKIILIILAVIVGLIAALLIWLTATQHYVIDGFILSPNVELTSVQTQDDGFRFSDHNPVLLNIRLK